MITTTHLNLPGTVSKQILKSMVGSINASAIAYARGHLRFDAIENISVAKNGRTLDEVPTIDDYNDARAALDEAIENGKASEAMGFVAQMPNGEIIERMMAIRNYLADTLMQAAVQESDKPLSIAQTIKFQLERTPDNNEALVETLAEAVGIDPELLKAAKIKMLADDRSDLMATAGRVVTYLQKFDGPETNHLFVEEQFDGLPAHVQFKLIGAAIRAYDKASQRAMMSLLRGKLDAATDIKLIKGAKEDAQLWLQSFAQAHRQELDNYLERGGTLPELEDRVIVQREPLTPEQIELDNKPKLRRVPKEKASTNA